MSGIDFKKAYYIKLGRGGAWEDECIATGKLRFGWSQQTPDDINTGRFNLIERQLRATHEGRPKGEATRALNGLRSIAESDESDVWITFHHAKLWWTRVASGPVERDDVSMFRRTAQPWSDRDANGRLLVANDLPGRLAQTQGFRWTTCGINHADVLYRTLNGTRSDLSLAISSDRAALQQHLTEAIRELHWKDFEILVDLVFRNAGWIRVSVLGQHAKAYDLELREPITGDRYVVQVKSRAGLADLEETVANFSAKDYRRVYFVVHSPSNDLANATDLLSHVEVIPPDVLARQAIDAGLVAWLEDKVC